MVHRGKECQKHAVMLLACAAAGAAFPGICSPKAHKLARTSTAMGVEAGRPGVGCGWAGAAASPAGGAGWKGVAGSSSVKDLEPAGPAMPSLARLVRCLVGTSITFSRTASIGESTEG